MNLIIIEEKLNKLDVDNYSQIMNEVISEIMNYINNNDSEIVTYYELLNFTGLNIPCYAKSYILSTLFNKSEKLRKICFSQALSEIKESLYKTFGIIDETLAQSLRNSILGENFILEGYDNSSWDEAIKLLNDLNQKKIMQSKEPEKIVFWSKIKDHTFLNNEFITIENSTLGSSMFFLDLVYNNWSSDCIESPKLEEFWKKLSKMFTKNTISFMNGLKKSNINFYFEYSEYQDYFGDIFLEIELPMLLKNNIRELIVHAMDEDNNEIKCFKIDLTDICEYEEIDSLSIDILRKYLDSFVLDRIGVNKR